jgi:hypothetical protein
MDARKRLLGFKKVSIDEESVCLFILQNDSNNWPHVVSKLVSQNPFDDENPNYNTSCTAGDENSPLPPMTFDEIIIKERLKKIGITCFEDAMVKIPENPNHTVVIYLYKIKEQEVFSK